jgi:hypothetical protein
LYFYLIKNKLLTQKPKAMKATKLFSVLSLVIFLTAATTGISNGIKNRNSQGSLAPAISHLVIIHFPAFTKDICNPYVVKLVDETGRLVAPVQYLLEGVNKYVFTENSPGMGKARTAILMQVGYPLHYICPSDFYTEPAVKAGPFKAGQTYIFDLYPVIKSSGSTDPKDPRE